MSTRFIVDTEGQPVEAIVNIEELRSTLEAQEALSDALKRLAEAIRNAVLESSPVTQQFVEESAVDLETARVELENARKMLRDLGLPEALEDLLAVRAHDADTELLESGEADLLPFDQARREIEEERAALRSRGEL